MILRRRVPVVVGVVTALCLSAAACTPTGSSTPSPTPTPSASPSETQLERQARLDFEAAEKAYRAFSAEYDRLASAGGALKPTYVLTDNAAGPFLKDAATTLRKEYEIKARSTGNLKIVYVRRGGYSTTKLTLDSCEDGSAVRIFDREGKPLGTGSTATLAIEMRRIDDRWRLWEATNSREVRTCAS